MAAPEKPILFFDGVCNLCNGMVKFILKRDRRKRILFAALQSARGRETLAGLGVSAEPMSSVILLEEGKAKFKSAAALGVMRLLGWPWKGLYGLILVPRPLRDFGYDLIAKNRYRVFGTRETCMLPSPEIESRFLE
jgi:predicted DCC family thiol-disulfide oxidoreductase YuxK